MGKNEDWFVITVFIGSGLLFLAMLFVLAAIAGSIVWLSANLTNDLLTSGYYDFGRTIGHEIFNIYAPKMAGVFMISTSTLFIRTKTIPRWMALLGYGLALLMLLRINHIDRLGWVSLAFPLWVFLISINIL